VPPLNVESVDFEFEIGQGRFQVYQSVGLIRGGNQILHFPGYTSTSCNVFFFDPFLKLKYLKIQDVLMSIPGDSLHSVQDLEALHIQPLPVEDSRKIELFPNLNIQFLIDMDIAQSLHYLGV